MMLSKIWLTAVNLEKIRYPDHFKIYNLESPSKIYSLRDFEHLIQEVDKGIHYFDRVGMHSGLPKEVPSDMTEGVQSMPSVKPSPLLDRAPDQSIQPLPLSDIMNLDFSLLSS